MLSFWCYLQFDRLDEVGEQNINVDFVIGVLFNVKALLTKMNVVFRRTSQTSTGKIIQRCQSADNQLWEIGICHGVETVPRCGSAK